MPNGDKKEPISVSVSSATVSLLEIEAEAQMTSKSQIVEIAVWEYCARRQVVAPRGRLAVLHHAQRVSQENEPV